MTDPDTFVEDWHRWRAERIAAVAAPGGHLTLTGTHWLSPRDARVLDGVPGRWWVDGTAVRVADAEGLLVDGVLTRDAVLRDDQRLTVGRLDLRIIRRGGDVAVRTFDPDADAVRRFAGIDAYQPDPSWVIEAEFRPAPATRTERIRHSNSDREADYRAVGTFTFRVGEERATLLGLDTGDPGTAHITFRDATSGRETYGAARFLFVPLPATAGRVALDFNRAVLPPCAFSDAFICPLPPPGNVLPFPVTAGEKQVLNHG